MLSTQLCSLAWEPFQWLKLSLGVGRVHRHRSCMEPILYADWAAPIVPVWKKDKESVRLCGDFKFWTDTRSLE